MAKGFDSISHTILLGKLERIGLHRALIKWLTSYLGNRKIITKLNNKESQTSLIKTGIPQGSCLGPQLFLIYINALSEVTKTYECHMLLYADDAVIYKAGDNLHDLQQSLQGTADEVGVWCAQNKLAINVDKSKICTYGTKGMLQKCPPIEIKINNHTLSRCQVYDYLGILLDEHLTMNNHFNRVKKNYSLRLFKLAKLRRCLSRETRVLVYKQTVLPVLEYADFVCYFYTVKQRDKLQRMQNMALRGCLDIFSCRDISIIELHNKVNLKPLSERRMSHLLSIMFDNKTRVSWLKDNIRPTRNSLKILFSTDIVNLIIYQHSPYFVGAQAWNNMPSALQDLVVKDLFKQSIKEWVRTYVTH